MLYMVLYNQLDNCILIRIQLLPGKGTALMAVSVTGHDYLLSLKEQKDRRADYYETLYMDLLERKARASGVPLNGQYELTPPVQF